MIRLLKSRSKMTGRILVAFGLVAALAATAGFATAGGSEPANTSPPTISGSPQIGQTLTAASGAWSGAMPITYAFQWRRCTSSCSSISGATDDNYPVGSADVGAKMQVRVTAANTSGSTSADSATTATVSGGTAP